MAAHEPADHQTKNPKKLKKPKKQKLPDGIQIDGTIVTVEIDGFPVRYDVAVARNIRLVRRANAGDLEANIKFLEASLPDLTELEDRFDLNTDEDYSAFLDRIQDAVKDAHPNS